MQVSFQNLENSNVLQDSEGAPVSGFGSHRDPLGRIVDDVLANQFSGFQASSLGSRSRMLLEQLLNIAMAVAEALIATALN